METKAPHRYAYFPPTQIFGRTIVPVYNSSYGPVVPLTEAAKAIGIPLAMITKTISKNQELFHFVDIQTLQHIPPSSGTSSKKNLGLAMDGICMLMLCLDQSRIADAKSRAKIVLAKQWIVAQVSNRVKYPGQKNQTRWDYGLTKEQSQWFKAQFARL